MKNIITTFLTFFVVLLASNAFSQTTNKDLNRAVSELQNGRYESGLAGLRRLDKTSNDARIDFYKGYAYEKLGKCVAAKLHYTSALKSDNEKLRSLSKKTLSDFSTRCTVINDTVSKTEASGSNTGWKIFGWSALLLGTTALIATPIKEGFDRDLSSKVEPYYFYKYGCKLDFGELGPGCNQTTLDKDERYPEYEAGVSRTKLINTIGYVSGVALVAAGAVTLISVAVSENSTVAISPTQNGAQFSVSF